MPAAPVLGLDLDLTLLDLRSATSHALRVMNRRCGERVDADAVLADLGVPFRRQLGAWIAPERLEACLAAFAGAFLTEALDLVTPMPGAAELLGAVTRLGGRSVVITGRSTKTATACLARCGLPVPVAAGGVTGLGKSPAMIANGLAGYVGDHPLDMAGATAASVPGIGVLTGSHRAEQLVGAGGAAVVPSLLDLADWLTRRSPGTAAADPGRPRSAQGDAHE
ncbi:haloacid dehalogenase-like hydrolase [Streptomyces sp. NPDC002589]|uniref:HAD family hydrolase n=1 Tax=Streptomyces sp. NPDC002589 TaxID=3154420 RepID=UPI003317AC9E